MPCLCYKLYASFFIVCYHYQAFILQGSDNILTVFTTEIKLNCIKNCTLFDAFFLNLPYLKIRYTVMSQSVK